MKRFAALLLTLSMLLLTGCFQSDMDPMNNYPPETTNAPLQIVTDTETTTALTETIAETTEETSEETTEDETTVPDEETAPPATSEWLTEETTGNEPLPASVEKDGSYTTPEDVAEYIHTFGTLPGNFITKNDAKALGWVSTEGNLWDVAPGKSIGGDRFGNREGLLPDGKYYECDVNFNGSYRGSERLIYSEDGRIYYTNDHYKSFTQLY